MKNTILIILLCGMMLFGITGCFFDTNDFEVGGESNITVVDNDIHLSIKEGTLTNTGATLILQNDTNLYVQYENPYTIEIKQDDSWHKINIELDFDMIAYELKPQESKEIELKWENGYGKLAKGEYRIIKSMDIKNEDGTYQKVYISAEFTIK